MHACVLKCASQSKCPFCVRFTCACILYMIIPPLACLVLSSYWQVLQHWSLHARLHTLLCPNTLVPLVLLYLSCSLMRTMQEAHKCIQQQPCCYRGIPSGFGPAFLWRLEILWQFWGQQDIYIQRSQACLHRAYRSPGESNNNLSAEIPRCSWTDHSWPVVSYPDSCHDGLLLPQHDINLRSCLALAVLHFYGCCWTPHSADAFAPDLHSQ